jgi:hypothetical protein
MTARNILLCVGLTSTALGAYTPAPTVATAEGSAVGNVVVLTAELTACGESDIYLLLDERRPDFGPDGQTDRVFTLQAKAGTVDPIWFSDQDVTVNWTPNEVTVLRDGEPLVTLAHTSSTLGSPNAALFARGPGLGHTTASRVAFPAEPGLDNNWNRSRLASRLLPGISCDDGPDCGCDGGGNGATSCSISGCLASPTSCSKNCEGAGGSACCWCNDGPLYACCRCGFDE